MYDYLKNINHVYEWDLDADYETCPTVDTVVIPNHNGTLSVIYASNQEIYSQNDEQLYYLCAIHKPMIWAQFDEYEECRCCSKLMNNAYDITMYSKWYILSSTFDGGNLLWLCPDCIALTQLYKNKNIISNPNWRMKAIDRKHDILFLYHSISPMVINIVVIGFVNIVKKFNL
jgi:hypothetical protein